MRTHYPVDVILWGDSLPTFAWQHGSTVGTIKVALGFFGASVFEFRDCPRGAASGYNTNAFNGLPLGWYVADGHPIEGKQGYTTDGVLWDILNEYTDPDELEWTRHEFCLAGTTVYETTDSYGVWADGIADVGDTNWSGMWTSTDQHGCVFHELLANPPTGRITTLGSIGHNDFVIQGHTGRGLKFDPPATTIVQEIADNLADGMVQIGRAFDRLITVPSEHVIISSPNWPFDDLDRQSPLAVGPTPGGGYHTDVPDDEYVSPYLNPGQLSDITFPPANEGSPGFAQEIWMGIHFVDQWIYEDGTHRRGWYDHWYADNHWPSFKTAFNTNSDAWTLAKNYSNGFVSNFHSLGYRAAFGTANLKSDTVAPLAHQAINGGHEAAETQLNAEGMAWRYIPGWDSMPVWDGTGPTYPHGDKTLWFDGIHMKEAAAQHWNRYLIERWFDESIHRRQVVQLSGRRQDLDLEARRPDVDLFGLRPDVDLFGLRQSVQFLKIIGDYVTPGLFGDYQTAVDGDLFGGVVGSTVYDLTGLTGPCVLEDFVLGPFTYEAATRYRLISFLSYGQITEIDPVDGAGGAVVGLGGDATGFDIVNGGVPWNLTLRTYSGLSNSATALTPGVSLASALPGALYNFHSHAWSYDFSTTPGLVARQTLPLHTIETVLTPDRMDDPTGLGLSAAPADLYLHVGYELRDVAGITEFGVINRIFVGLFDSLT